jgi:anti-sigma regulatory factor (Ser/Thr protein kinase)
MPAEARGSIQRSFRPEDEAAGAARRALEELRAEVDDDLLERSRLVVTEVVTNSVRHARWKPSQVIDMQILVLPNMVRIEVTDPGPGFDRGATRPDPDNAAATGWGLWLVDRLTTRWGVDRSQSTRVWLEFDR